MCDVYTCFFVWKRVNNVTHVSSASMSVHFSINFDSWSHEQYLFQFSQDCSCCTPCRSHTLQTSSTRSLPQMVTLIPGDAPYMKQFVHSKSQQYRRLKTEWRSNVYLRRSNVQVCGLSCELRNSNLRFSAKCHVSVSFPWPFFSRVEQLFCFSSS